MTTHFITAEIEINQNQEAIAKTIVQELAKHGEPLRWAIVNVDATKSTNQIVQVEAVVTRN